MKPEFHPRVTIADNHVRLDFVMNASPLRTIETEFVVDYNLEGWPVGIEILSFKHAAGSDALDAIICPAKVEDIRCTYDEDCDAFTVWFGKDHSADQESVLGKIYLDSAGRAVAFEFSFIWGQAAKEHRSRRAT